MKTFHKSVIVLTLILTLTVPSILATQVRRAEADIGSILSGAAAGVGGCLISGAISGLLDTAISGITGLFTDSVLSTPGITSDQVPVFDETQEDQMEQNLLDNIESIGQRDTIITKEFVLDCLTWAAQKLIVDELTNSSILFLQEDFFNDAPFFIEDISQFYANLDDQTADYFIDTVFSGASTVGGDYHDVILTYLRDTRGSGARTLFEFQAENTLSNTGFIDDFSAGGLEVYGEFLLNPEGNNPVITLFEANEEITRLQEIAADEIRTATDQSGGFLPELEGELTVTPGSLLQDQATNIIQAGLENLNASDELSEFLTALLGTVFSSLLSDTTSFLDL